MWIPKIIQLTTVCSLYTISVPYIRFNRIDEMTFVKELPNAEYKTTNGWLAGCRSWTQIPDHNNQRLTSTNASRQSYENGWSCKCEKETYIAFFSFPFHCALLHFSFRFHSMCVCLFIYLPSSSSFPERKREMEERKKQNKTNRMRDNNMNTKMTNDRMEKKTLSFISSFCALISMCVSANECTTSCAQTVLHEHYMHKQL